MKKIAYFIVPLALAIAACGGRSGEDNQVRPNSGHGGADKGTNDNV